MKRSSSTLSNQSRFHRLFLTFPILGGWLCLVKTAQSQTAQSEQLFELLKTKIKTTQNQLLKTKIVEMDFLIVRKERFKRNSFVLEKSLVYLIISFCGPFFANRK